MGLLISKCLVYETDSDGNGLLAASVNDGSVSTGKSAVSCSDHSCAFLLTVLFLHRQTDADRSLAVFVTSNSVRRLRASVTKLWSEVYMSEYEFRYVFCLFICICLSDFLSWLIDIDF